MPAASRIPAAAIQGRMLPDCWSSSGSSTPEDCLFYTLVPEFGSFSKTTVGICDFLSFLIRGLRSGDGQDSAGFRIGRCTVFLLRER